MTYRVFHGLPPKFGRCRDITDGNVAAIYLCSTRNVRVHCGQVNPKRDCLGLRGTSAGNRHELVVLIRGDADDVQSLKLPYVNASVP